MNKYFYHHENYKKRTNKKILNIGTYRYHWFGVLRKTFSITFREKKITGFIKSSKKNIYLSNISKLSSYLSPQRSWVSRDLIHSWWNHCKQSWKDNMIINRVPGKFFPFLYNVYFLRHVYCMYVVGLHKWYLNIYLKIAFTSLQMCSIYQKIDNIQKIRKKSSRIPTA